ncbi:transcriptional regulator, AraC family [Belnapia rosea]|uniref:Transcriptional regulator, AraC family n=1 Tax=Belnapia rosea TaxID=938405 RepID=A0A1G7C7W9_9PROT|nr:transcriptional regulator, AraC family [Belnapia rosea]
MSSRSAETFNTAIGPKQGTNAAIVSRLLQDAQDLLACDRHAAFRALAHASRLLDMPEVAERPVVHGGLAQWQVNRLTRYVDSHLERQILQKHLAAEVRLSIGHLARAFKQSFGRTAHTYVMERRIDRAKTMMLETTMPLCEIAIACGLADQAHFSRVFRRITGDTPLAWRRRNQPAPRR